MKPYPFQNQKLVAGIIAAMKAKIAQYHLEILERYPNDILVDQAVLEDIAVPGAKIAWMCGHLHTHIVPLGIHQEENEMVQCFINMGSDDRFFVINVNYGENFTMNELSRKEFSQLDKTSVPYEIQGTKSDFWLYRHKSRVGYIKMESVGTLNAPKISSTITPVSGISDQDKAALSIWCRQSMNKFAGTLFRQSEVSWAEPIALLQAA